MGREQRIVATGALCGVLGMAALVALLHFLVIPTPTGLEDEFDNVVLTLRADLFAALPLLAGVVAVANARFLGEAIDPLRHAEGRALEVDARFVDDTLQQLVLFLVGTLALSTSLTAEGMRIVPALVVTFIVARLVFWVGYRIDPLYRAPGMSATAYLNLGVLLAASYRILAG